MRKATFNRSPFSKKLDITFRGKTFDQLSTSNVEACDSFLFVCLPPIPWNEIESTGAAHATSFLGRRGLARNSEKGRGKLPSCYRVISLFVFWDLPTMRGHLPSAGMRLKSCGQMQTSVPFWRRQAASRPQSTAHFALLAVRCCCCCCCFL